MYCSNTMFQLQEPFVCYTDQGLTTDYMYYYEICYAMILPWDPYENAPRLAELFKPLSCQEI